MTREEIRNEIEFILNSAWENSSEAIYYLEQLPKDDSDCDWYVKEIVSRLNYQIKKQNKEYFEFAVEDLIEHYFINQEYYEAF